MSEPNETLTITREEVGMGTWAEARADEGETSKWIAEGQLSSRFEDVGKYASILDTWWRSNGNDSLPSVKLVVKPLYLVGADRKPKSMYSAGIRLEPTADSMTLGDFEEVVDQIRGMASL